MWSDLRSRTRGCPHRSTGPKGRRRRSSSWRRLDARGLPSGRIASRRGARRVRCGARSLGCWARSLGSRIGAWSRRSRIGTRRRRGRIAARSRRSARRTVARCRGRRIDGSAARLRGRLIAGVIVISGLAARRARSTAAMFIVDCIDRELRGQGRRTFPFGSTAADSRRNGEN